MALRLHEKYEKAWQFLEEKGTDMHHILNQAEAEAVYGAMCALNSVGGKVKAMFGDVSISGVNVFEEMVGAVSVVRVCRFDVLETENYANQATFAAAYGLDGKEPRTAEYTPGLGWQTVTKTGRRGSFDTEAQALAV